MKGQQAPALGRQSARLVPCHVASKIMKFRKGGTISFAKRDCECAQICPRTNQKICFDALDPVAFPWGRGAAGKPIHPLRTIAADTNVLPMGTVIYLPELDGAHAQMSVYLIGPWGWLLQAGYIALAVGITLLAANLYRVPPATHRSAAPLLLFAIGAASLAVTALAPMRFPEEDLRLVHLVHGTSAQAAFLCTTAAMVLQALRLRHAPEWRQLVPMLLAGALACSAGVWVLALADDLPRGLSQKLLVAGIVAWLATTALQSTRLNRGRSC